MKLVVPDLRKQSGPFGRVDAVLGEDVSTLPVSDAVAKLRRPRGGVPVEKGEVNAMLSAKVAHGIVHSGFDYPES